jgi:dCMP deaminase
MNEKWELRFLELAKLISGWSKDPSTKVGAVITLGNQPLGIGINGFPRGMPDREELYADRTEKYSRIVHGEVNALLHASTPLPDGCTLYTWPCLSCDRCAVLMLQAGIRRFVAPFPTTDALSRWGDAFERTKKYVVECGGEVIEIRMD